MKNIILFFFLMIGSCLIAQNKINLELTVYNQYTNESIPFADIRIVNTTTNQKLAKKTNFNGNVKIDLFPNMNYKLTVSAVSDSNVVVYKNKTMDFNTQKIQAGNNIEYQAKLMPSYKKEGLKFIKNLNFDVFTFTLDKESKIILDNIVEVMSINSEITLEIGAYASCNLTEDDANSVSVERAKVVVFYLTGKGIDYQRIKAAAWGKEKSISDCTCEPKKPKDKPCTKRDHLKNSRVSFDFIGIE